MSKLPLDFETGFCPSMCMCVSVCERSLKESDIVWLGMEKRTHFNSHNAERFQSIALNATNWMLKNLLKETNVCSFVDVFFHEILIIESQLRTSCHVSEVNQALKIVVCAACMCISWPISLSIDKINDFTVANDRLAWSTDRAFDRPSNFAWCFSVSLKLFRKNTKHFYWNFVCDEWSLYLVSLRIFLLFCSMSFSAIILHTLKLTIRLLLMCVISVCVFFFGLIKYRYSLHIRNK